MDDNERMGRINALLAGGFRYLCGGGRMQRTYIVLSARRYEALLHRAFVLIPIWVGKLTTPLSKGNAGTVISMSWRTGGFYFLKFFFLGLGLGFCFPAQQQQQLDVVKSSRL